MTNPLPKVVSVLFAALVLTFVEAFAPSGAFAGLAGVAKGRFALVVSNEYYPEIGDLHFSHADGQIIAKTLLELNFQVELARDNSIDGIRQALSRMKQKAEAAGPDSVVFFYFSGHAAEDGTKNYVLLNERVPKSFNPSDYGSKRAVLPIIGIPYSEVTASWPI